ncbi:MAG TPA: hypothetical protein VIK78_19580 [Ruminiclostridium sp.]
MNIKIRCGEGVTELVENLGKWKIKRNGANIEDEKIKAVIKAMGVKKAVV